MSAWKEVSLFAAFAVGFHTQARAAAWELQPRASLSIGYEDNVRMSSSAPVGSDTETAQIRARLVRYSDALDVSIEPTVTAIHYSADQDLNRTEGVMDVGAQYEGELDEWNASARYVLDTTRTSELGLSGIVDVDRRHRAVIADLNPSRQLTERWTTGGQLYWSNHSYDGNAASVRLYDYDYGRVAGNASFAYSERASLGIDLSFGRQSVRTLDIESKNYAATLTFKRLMSERWTISASAGPSRVETGPISQDGAVYSVASEFRGQRATLGGALAKEVIATGAGALSKSDRASLTAGWKFSERFSADVAAQWIRNEEMFSALDLRLGALRYVRISGGVNWSVSPNWRVSAMAAWSEQKRDAAFFQTEETLADGYSASAFITWGGLPRVF